MTIKLASSPSKNSSITIFFPASPNISDSRDCKIASFASSNVYAIVTPLPAARPSAFITIGHPFSSTYFIACFASLKDWYSAVGILFSFKNCFINSFEPSS